MMPKGKDEFTAVVPVAVSPQFYGWMAGLGDGIELISPEPVRNEYREHLNKIINKLIYRVYWH